jgi:hypothetical protein
MPPMRRLIASFLVLGLVLAVGAYCCAQRENRRAAEPDDRAPQAVDPGAGVDLSHKPLDHIRVGTVIGKEPPEGWSHLVLFAIPTLTPQDARDAPRIAGHYAQMFKFTVLANVARRAAPAQAPFYLEKVARGFATNVEGKQTIVSGKNTLGANLGAFGRRILDENEKILDEDVRQVVRTPTMLIFDAKAVMLRGGEHVDMIMRHAIEVDPASGRLYTLVWLLTEDYQPAERALQLLPKGMHEKRLLSVKRDKFTLGIPNRDAFALRQIPQGTAVPYTPALRQAATVKKFEAGQVPRVEETLRDAAIRAAGN